MEFQQLQILLGMASSGIFVVSNLPMLLRAFRTRNLASYSLIHLSLANVGNLMHWLYVISLPLGPIWLLHGFNTLVAGVMLMLYLRCELGLLHPAQTTLRRAPLSLLLISTVKRKAVS